MANFLDDLSSYNAKAALAISNAVAEGNTQKANMMSSLKSTANDTTLSDTIRLNALTALINMGSLLDIPLPPYFPTAATYANTQTYVGIHNDLSGLQGGQAGEYFHLTQAQYNNLANAATLADINFANLGGSYTQNAGLNAAINAKQNALNGTGFVKISGTTISYDNSVYLTSSTGIASGSAAGGELTGTYPNPALSNAAVISKVLTGWNGTATPASVTSSDSILTALQKINANVNQIIASPPGVASVALTNNAGTVFSTTSSPQTGAAILNVSLNTQNKNLFLASSSTTNGLVPSFRAIAAADLPVSGVTAGSYGTATDIPVLTIDNKGRITLASVVAAASGGQVNSVTMTVPSGTVFNAVNSGTATDPVVGFSLQTQSANTVFAGPTTGSAAVPGFRSLVLADIAGITIPQSQIDGLSATLSTFMTNSLANSTMYVGNASNAAVNAAVAGDLTMAYVNNSGTNEANFTIANGVVTYAKMQNVTAQTVLGRYALTNGVAQELTFNASDFTINSSTGVIGLVTPNPPTLTHKGDLLTSNGVAQVRLGIGANATLFMADSAASTGNKWVAMSGDVTIATSGATTIANSAVTLAKIANIANDTVLGNISGSSAAPAALSKAQLTSLVNQFTSSLSGIVPASGGGTTNFLRADGNWAPVSGTGTVTDVSVATANGFTGSVATSTTTPDISIALDGITGVLAGAGSTIQAAASGIDYVEPGAITATSGAGSGLQMTGSALLGRTGAGLGAIQQISANSTLSLASTTLGINLGNANTWTVQQQFPSIRLNGSTSGFVVIQPPAIAGSQTYTLPAATPSGANQFLTSTTGGVLSWSVPTGGTTSNAITFNNSGSGAASGTTFDGSVARTISYNTIGAQALNANLTGLSALSYGSGTPFVKMTAAGTFALDTNTYVTNVTFTGGIISVANGSTTPAFTVSGTQGGLVYFTGANTWASSPALDQYELMMGGGTGAPTTINTGANNTLLISNGVGNAPSWTTATYLTTTQANRIIYSSANNVVDQIVAPTLANTFLKWDGSSFTWATAGGGGSGTVSNVSVVAANGFSGSVADPTTTPAITLSTSITGILKGSSGALVAAIPGTDYAPATSGTSILKGNGSGGFANATAGTDYLTSVGLSMPAAFTVTNSPLTANGTISVTGAGTTAQYVRGDGTLGVFPSVGGGGGGTVYYLNGGVSQGTFGGVAMKQLSPSPITAGGSVDFTASTNGATLASFITDSGDPNQTSIPPGLWVFEAYLSAAGGGSTNATVQAVVETWNGTAITVIATGPSEEITNGTAKDLYQFAVTIPTGTTISLTDRIVVQIKVVAAAGKTITLYTQDGNVSSVKTTFPNGIVNLNGLTAGTQVFANGFSGTTPAFVSSVSTHTLNIPLASTASVTAGLISNTDYTTFSNKISNPMTTLGDIIYGGASGTPTRLAGQTTNGTYFLRANVTASTSVAPDWLGSTGSGNVVLATSPTLVTPSLGVATATSINDVIITDPGTTATLSLANNSTLATSGAFSLTLTTTATTNATLPTGTITLVDLASSQALSNKSYSGTSLDVSGAVTSGVASATAGTLVLRNATSSATQTLRGTNPTTSIIYDFPTTAPTVGQVLSASAPSAGVVTLSWASTGGNVTGPGSLSTNGNFAVFSGSGTTIAESSIATLSNTTGRATFNNGIDVGVSGTTTGTIIFNGSGGTGRTILQAPALPGSVDINYYWPASQGSNTQVLANDGNGVLYWTATGTGNVTTAGTQTFTGLNTFNNGTIRLANAAGTIFTTLSTNVATANKAIAFPDLAGTVALANANQTISGVNTYSGNQTFNAGTLRIQSTGGNFVTLQSTSDFGGRIVNFPNTTGVVTAVDVAYANFANTFSGANTFTASTTFNASTLRIQGNAGGASAVTLTSTSDSGFRIVNFPNTAGVVTAVDVAYANFSNAFSAAQTFASATTFSLAATTGTAISITGAGSTSTPQLAFSGSTSWISYTNPSGSAPSFTTRSIGTKIVLFQNISATTLDSAYGVLTGGGLWFTSPGSFSFYATNGGGVTSPVVSMSVAHTLTTILSELRLSTAVTSAQIRNNGLTSFIASGIFSNGNANTNFATCSAVGAAFTTRSLGTRFIIHSTNNQSNSDYAIGVEGTDDGTTNSGMWISVQNTSQYFKFMAQSTVYAQLNGTGVLNLSPSTGRLQINGTQVVSVRETGYTAFTGTTNKATSYATGTVTLVQLAERVAAIQASLTTHGLIGA